MYELWKSLFTEFIGTMILVFIAGSAAILAFDFQNSPISSALAMGLTYMFLIYTLNNYSGANFNPAVSFGLALSGRLGWCRMVLYWLVQVLGAVAAGGLIGWIFNVEFGNSNMGDLVNDNVWKLVLVETLITAFFVFVFLVVTKNPHLSMLSGFIIGLALTAVILASGLAIRVGVNPAFSIGLGVFGGNWMIIGYLILGNVFGALLAALIYRLLNFAWTCEELNMKGCDPCGQMPFEEMHKECIDPTFMARGAEQFALNAKELEAEGLNTSCMSPCDVIAPKCDPCDSGLLAPVTRRGRRAYRSPLI